MKTTIYGIDPGPGEATALVELRPDKKARVVLVGSLLEVQVRLRKELQDVILPPPVVAIERVTAYGMRVGNETFRTAEIVGALALEALLQDAEVLTVPRPEIKRHLLPSMPGGTDSQVNQAVAIRFAEDIQKAKGTKKAPGPLYGFTSHAWPALAVAVVVSEVMEAGGDWQKWRWTV